MNLNVKALQAYNSYTVVSVTSFSSVLLNRFHVFAFYVVSKSCGYEHTIATTLMI